MGSSRQPSGHCPDDRRTEAGPGGSAYRRLSCLESRCPTWRQDRCLRGKLLPGFQRVPASSASCGGLEIHPRPVYGQARRLWGQVSCEQSCCRLQSTSSPAARVTPEARPAHVLADAKAFRVLAPAPQHPLRPGDANPERGADRRTSGLGLGGEKLTGARHRLLCQAVPQGQCLRPIPASHAHAEPEARGHGGRHPDLHHSSPSRVSASFSSSACCFCCWILA